MTEAELEKSFPEIEWREPLPAKLAEGGSGLACRLCIGMYGLRGRDIPALPQTPEEFDRHLLEKHNLQRTKETEGT